MTNINYARKYLNALWKHRGLRGEFKRRVRKRLVNWLLDNCNNETWTVFQHLLELITSDSPNYRLIKYMQRLQDHVKLPQQTRNKAIHRY